MAVPIWKDINIEVQGTTLHYRIRKDSTTGDIIYEGRAVAKPNATSVIVRINDIISDYLTHSLPSLGTEYNAGGVARTFVFEQEVSDEWEQVGTDIEVMADWSYDSSYVASRDGLSFPIRRVIDRRGAIPYSTLGQGQVAFTVVTQEGEEVEIVVYNARTADFNDDYNNDFARIADEVVAGTSVLNLHSYPYDYRQVRVGGITYDIDNSLCRRYMLYYVNAYGGWDALLADGNTQKADAYTRTTYKRDYDNTQETEGNTNVLVNQIARSFTLHTGWLDDTGGQRMHHLLGSTMMYLQDLQEGWMMPVEVNTNACEYKTYISNGRRLIDYTIKVTLAKDIERR